MLPELLLVITPPVEERICNVLPGWTEIAALFTIPGISKFVAAVMSMVSGTLPLARKNDPWTSIPTCPGSGEN